MTGASWGREERSQYRIFTSILWGGGALPIDPSNLSATAVQTFDDEFNTLSLWNGTSGTWSTTFWYDNLNGNGGTLASNGEQEWYINSNDAATSSVKPWVVNNGILNISATPTPPGIASLVNNYAYVSGELNTYHSFSQTYGYFEMKAELPAGQGLWPAFWLLPEDGSWPPELDVMEMLGNAANVVYTTVHSNDLASGKEAQANTVADTSSGYHTFGVDWEADFITWYVDGKAVYKVATPADMNKPMYMLVNLAVGGGWPGSPNSSTPFPADMKIDYIRAYQAMPTTGGSTGGATGAGQTLTAASTGSTLVGGAGNDTFYGSQGGDILTGGGGSNTYVFQKEPWAPETVTDFKVGADKLDLSTLLSSFGYSGSDPVKDGWLFLYGDNNGGTIVRLQDHSGAHQWPNTIIDLQHVSPVGLTWAQLSGAAGAGATPTPPTTTPPVSTPPVSTPPVSTPPVSTPPAGTGGGGTPSSTGVTLTATHAGQTLTGGAGNDVLIGGAGNDTLTGAGGANTFKFNAEPWAPNVVTDFKPGVDKLDFSGMFSHFGYAGSDPIKDGWMFVYSDGSGGSILRFQDHSGAHVWPNTIIDLQHVAPSQVSVSDWILH